MRNIIADFREWPLKITAIALDHDRIMVEANGQWFEAKALEAMDKELLQKIKDLADDHR